MGRPRLFVGVSAGNLDSMLNKLTAQKKVRSEDQYSPGGRPNARPNRASIVYANLCRQAFPGLPVVLGGIEASLRRIAHYDYWSDSVRRSILLDAKADLLVFGMGERAAWEIARRLDAGESVDQLDRRARHGPRTQEPLALGRASRRIASRARTGRQAGRAAVVRGGLRRQAGLRAHVAHAAVRDQRPQRAAAAAAARRSRRCTSTRPPCRSRRPRWTASTICPSPAVPTPATAQERIPAFETIKHSIVTMRGCFGGCTFCSITEHEGRIIQSRSAESVLREVRALSRMDDFRGTITDVGGPTANMYKMRCKDERTESACRRLSCVHVTDGATRPAAHLREPRHRPRPAHRPAEQGAQGAGGRPRLRRERRPLRPRRRAAPSSSASSRATTPAGSSASRPSTPTPRCSAR